ncbi:MAG: lysophospholipid acyltransferase family protein [Polyangiaceae bacterium]
MHTADSLSLRRLALLGARFGPDWWLRYSPPLIGLVFAGLLPEQRRHVARNLEALGVRSPLAPLRTFASYAACLAEGLALAGGRSVEPQVEVTGAHHLSEVLRSPHGVILVTAHVGPWDAAAPLLARRGELEVSIVMRREPDARARAFHDDLRRTAGVQVVHVGEHPLEALGLRRALGPGRALAFQLDRWQAPGLPSSVPEGPFRLASLTGAPLISVFAARVGMFDYRLRIDAPRRFPRRGAGAAIARGREELLAALLEWIRCYPTQWFDFDQPAL